MFFNIYNMIKEDKVLISVNLRNKKMFLDKGYDCNDVSIDNHKEIEVNINDVNKTSKVRITAICEICNSENPISVNKYWRNYHRNDKNYYSCFKCKTKELKKTCLKKYGVDSYSKTKKFKETESEKWKGIKKGAEKGRKTILERYGVESYFQTEEMRERNRKWMSSDEFKIKSKETLIEKYGFDSYSKTEDFKNTINDKKELILSKMKETCLERYGVDWISKSDNWKEKYFLNSRKIINKIKQTCLEKYGVDNVSKVKSVMKKIMNTKYVNGTSVHSDLLDDWEIYKRNVNRLTKRVKKELYENWDGYDYYDNEYIRENANLYYTDKNYPTIDHKISVFHGFSNGISEEEISGIDNLCITKRSINSMKNSKIEADFDI